MSSLSWSTSTSSDVNPDEGPRASLSACTSLSKSFSVGGGPASASCTLVDEIVWERPKDMMSTLAGVSARGVCCGMDGWKTVNGLDTTMESPRGRWMVSSDAISMLDVRSTTLTWRMWYGMEVGWTLSWVLWLSGMTALFKSSKRQPAKRKSTQQHTTRRACLTRGAREETSLFARCTSADSR